MNATVLLVCKYPGSPLCGYACKLWVNWLKEMFMNFKFWSSITWLVRKRISFELILCNMQKYQIACSQNQNSKTASPIYIYHCRLCSVYRFRMSGKIYREHGHCFGKTCTSLWYISVANLQSVLITYTYNNWYSRYRAQHYNLCHHLQEITDIAWQFTISRHCNLFHHLESTSSGPPETDPVAAHLALLTHAKWTP